MRNLRIGSVLGIPIQLDLTFLLVLPLVAYLIGIRVSALASLLNQIWDAGIVVGPLSVGWLPWVLGTFSALGLFVCVVLHELGHSFVARFFGFATESITLWFLGGVASFTDIPDDWRQEFLIAIAGPAVSILLGAICYAFLKVSPPNLGAIRFIVGYLGLLNFILAIFNLLPGFPMDGGRILRALLARTYPHTRATQIAASVGKGVAILLGLLGLLSFNIFLIGIAFFVYISASGEAVQTTLSAAFEGVTVREIMTPMAEIDTVRPEMSITDLFEQMFRQRHVGYPVVTNGEVVGIVTLGDATQIPPRVRDEYTVRAIMTTDLKTIFADSDAEEAFVELQRNDIGRLLVVDDRGEVVGLVTRTDITTVIEIAGQ